MAREDTPGDKRLVAYYTTSHPAASDQDISAAEQLRTHLSSVLPEHMVPAAYVSMESLPLTLNGKLDRRALPAPEAGAYAMRGYEPPQGGIETALAQIWAEVLKLDRIGRHDNFFSLGGHSLPAVRGSPGCGSASVWKWPSATCSCIRYSAIWPCPCGRSKF